MGKEGDQKQFYDILNLSRGASLDNIRQQYRKLALKYHPDQNQDAGADEQFQLVAESYDVLSNAKWRAIYDQYGANGLYVGAPKGTEQFTEAYAFHGDAVRVFKEFFGTENPFQDLFMSLDEFHVGPDPGQRTRLKQETTIERPLNVSLEEAYLGCVKKMKVSRKVMNEDGHTSSVRDKILTIHVKKGWKEGTKVTFAKEGDQGPNHIPADVTFVVKYKDHPRFKREGDNLVHTVTIPLADALTGCLIGIQTLDGRQLSIPIHDVISFGYEKRIPGEGMPSSSSDKTGDLLIRFKIVFPTTLSEKSKGLIREGLA